MNFLTIAVLFSCASLTVSVKNTYKAAVLKDVTHSYNNFIQEAAKSDVDILVMPSSAPFTEPENYDENIKSLSSAAKESNIYIVAHLYEKARCQNKMELIRSNLVFDRAGAVVSVFRKPVNNVVNCTSSEPQTFSTDFGVTFSLLMEEDLVLRKPDDKLMNYVVAGAWDSKIPFLNAPQFASSWAYVTKANLVSAAGIYAGRSGLNSVGSNLITAELNKEGCQEMSTSPVVASTKSLPEDLSQYIIRPVDLEASAGGYKETVCHGKFCCEFYVKTGFVGSNAEINYGLAAFNGVRHFGQRYSIGAQSCAVFACAGLYKRTCSIGSQNNTNIVFDKVVVTGNFTKRNSAQFPVIVTDSSVINFDTTVTTDRLQVTIEMKNSVNLLSFGVFGRDYSKDFESDYVPSEATDFYDYFFNEDFEEFFDYMWIRVRILLVVVSIYFLEMM